MKLLKILLTFLIIHSCNGQENKGVTTYPKEKIMNKEKFDITNFKNYQAEQQNLPYGNPSERITEKNGVTITEYSMVSSDKGREYGREVLPPAPALFYSVQIFHENGNIKEYTDRVFLGTFDFDYGIHQFYDDNGILLKTVDYTKSFEEVKIKVEDLFKILENENLKAGTIDKATEDEVKNKWFPDADKITSEMVMKQLNDIFEETKVERGTFEKKFLNPNNREDVKRIRIDFDNAKKQWIVTKDFSVLGKIKLFVDAGSGKILENSFEL